MIQKWDHIWYVPSAGSYQAENWSNIMSVKYLKGSLFDAPEGSLLVHACNTQGVWGSGIAKAFHSEYPDAYKNYNRFCTLNSGRDIRGEFLSCGGLFEKHRVGALMTSAGFGANVDDPDTILLFTALAVDKLLKEMSSTDMYGDVVYSNKFNSGLFRVPWEQTEWVINTLLRKHPRVEWVVYEG